MDTRNFIEKNCRSWIPRTVTNPFKIKNEQDLLQFKERVENGYTDLNAIVTKDFELSQPWIPIGDIQNKYQGIFDGNNHCIANLKIDHYPNTFVGLFGYINTFGVVKNVILDNPYIPKGYAIGGIAGTSSGMIQNCTIRNGVLGSSENVMTPGGGIGGIVGMTGFHSKIIGCSNTANVIANGNTMGHLGGIVGDATNHNAIIACYNGGYVLGDENNNGVGGIAGSVQCGVEIVGCCNEGEVTGGGSVGGIAGFVNHFNTIAECINEGSIYGSRNSIGGILGTVGDYVTVRDCFNYKGVNGDEIVGGIVGYVRRKSIVIDCINRGTVTGNKDTGDIVGFIKYKSTVTVARDSASLLI